jgi:hypothetical protein
LDQIEKNDTWELVPRPKNKNVIGTKWVFRNKLNEDGQVTRNKARLVLSLKFRPHRATRTPHHQNRKEVIHGTRLIPQHSKRVKNYTK